jgi:hypothetical protein
MASLNTFMTGNTELAAFLATKGERLESVRGAGARAEFYFEQSPTLQSAVADFAANAPGPARALFESLRLMKSLAKDATQSQSQSNQRRSYEHRN